MMNDHELELGIGELMRVYKTHLSLELEPNRRGVSDAEAVIDGLKRESDSRWRKMRCAQQLQCAETETAGPCSLLLHTDGALLLAASEADLVLP